MRWCLWALPLLSLSLAQTTSGSLNDLAGLRSVLNAPGELHLVVPQITPWALQLAQWRTAGSTTFYIPKSEAVRYCGSPLPIRVLPGEVKEPLGLIVGQGGTLEGIALRGLGLIYDPGWAENDRIALWMGLSGPRTGRAWVEGSWTGGLTARVEFQVTERYLGDAVTSSYLFNHVWNGTIQDVRAQGYDPYRIYNGETLTLVEANGTVRGNCTLRSRTTTVEVGVDTGRTTIGNGVACCGSDAGATFSFNPGSGVETFSSVQTSKQCNLFGCTRREYAIYDLQGRNRGWGVGWQCGTGWCQQVGIYPLRYETRKTHEEVTARVRPWLERVVWQAQGTFVVEVGGVVRVNGEVYRIPGLEGYGRRPQGVGIEWLRGEPLVSYMARASGIMGGEVYRGQVMDLREYCTNVR
jgi:hypothetical protein